MEKFINDCKEVINKNPDFEKLFNKTNEIIDFHLNGSLEIKEFLGSLAMLGGDEFPRVIILSLRNMDNYEDFNELLELGINEEFVNCLRLLVAKYKIKFERFVEKENNPYGWNSVSSAIVKIGSKEYLEIAYKLNNDQDVLIRDEPSDHLDYIYYVLSKIKEMKEKLSNEELIKVNEEIEKIRKLIYEN